MATLDLSSLESTTPVLVYMSADDVERDVAEFGADSWYAREGWYLVNEETGKPLIGPRHGPDSCYH
jgi:hypothetical protein